MRVLVACEYSGRVRNAFSALGHHAVSCDILPSETEGIHIQGDVRDILDEGWDIMVAFPPCQYLTKSNAWRWDDIRTEREDALGFVRHLMYAPIHKIAIENPSGAIGTNIRKADQYIQPWQYGDPFQKMTGLWLKNLPLLIPEVVDRPRNVRPWAQGTYNGTWAGEKRNSHERSLTFEGIARAMADQWGARN